MRSPLIPLLAGFLPNLSACIGYKWTSGGETTWSVGMTEGATGLWILSNISYAGMRAQAHPSTGWRALAFIFGLPGTLVTYFAVTEGGCRAYGVSLPRPDRESRLS